MRRNKGFGKRPSVRGAHSQPSVPAAPPPRPLVWDEIVWVQVTRASVRAHSSRLCAHLSISEEEAVLICVKSLDFASYEEFLVRDRKGRVLYFLIPDRWVKDLRALVGTERGDALSNLVLEELFWVVSQRMV